MSSSNTAASVLNALGTLIGYIGAEVVTADVFERLLWPQRFYNSFHIGQLPWMAVFLPMGGPLHKAALSTLDHILRHGLFRGTDQGHMLGSPFYRDMNLRYLVYDDSGDAAAAGPEKEHVRNGLWVRAIQQLAFDPIAAASPAEAQRDPEKGLEKQPPAAAAPRRRARTRVCHLTISLPDRSPEPSELCGNEIHRTTLKTYLALLTTEVTGIAVAVAAYTVWRSWFLWLWLAPLFLKLISAAFAMDRTGLEPTPPSSKVAVAREPDPSTAAAAVREREKSSIAEEHRASQVKKFEILDSNNGFLIIEGDEHLILQFFRHYGHPIRNRLRETVQIGCVIAYGLVFPIGLLASIIWMSEGLQFLWLGYQLYTTLVMHVYRYAGGPDWGTTEEGIAKRLELQARQGRPQRIYFADKANFLMATLETSYYNRYKDARAQVDKMVQSGQDESSVRRVLKSRETDQSSTTALSRETTDSSVRGLIGDTV